MPIQAGCESVSPLDVVDGALDVHTALHYTVQYFIALYFTLFDFIVLYCTVIRCTGAPFSVH